MTEHWYILQCCFPNLSAYVFWQKVQSNSSIHVQAHWDAIDGGIICMGMVLVWMKKSISAKGNGIHSADQLGSSHLMAIVHGAYRKVVPLKELKHEVDIITHMFLTQNLAPGDFMKGLKTVSDNLLLSKTI